MGKLQLYILGLLLLLPQLTFAQQDPQFTLYMFNTLQFNPAYAGIDGVTNITAIHRDQWAGYESTFDDGGAPTTQVLSLNTPIFKLNSGFGFHVVNDNLGAQNNLEFQASYAYHLGFKKSKSKMSFGLRLGIYSQSINFDEYRPIDTDDPILAPLEGTESQIRPDMAIGVFYRAEKYYAGVSYNHLLRSEFDFGTNVVRNALEEHAYITFGYIYQVNFDVSITPSFLVQTDMNQYNFILGGIVDYKDKMWGGVSFTEAESANVLLGYNFLKDRSLTFGYSFGYVIAEQEAKQPTSHEIMLSYTLPVVGSIGKKQIRTPRFRN